MKKEYSRPRGSVAIESSTGKEFSEIVMTLKAQIAKANKIIKLIK